MGHRFCRHMARIPSSLALEDLEEILPHLVDEGLPGGSEFLVASLDEGERTASLIALLVWHGFLPMSGVGMLLGKMHLQRCVLEPSKTHVGKKVRKRAKAFRLSVNQAWSEVVQNIQRHTWTSAPGDCWLSDKMAQALGILVPPPPPRPQDRFQLSCRASLLKSLDLCFSFGHWRCSTPA